MATTVRPCNVLDIQQTAAGQTVNEDFATNRPFTIAEIVGYTRATQANTTGQLFRQALGAGNFNAICATMALATIGDVVRPANIVLAEQSFVATDVIRLATANGGAASLLAARVFVMFTPIAGAT